MTSTSLVEANGINLLVTVDGPEDGRPVLLLHGFPDSHYIWRHQVAALAAAGYRAIAVDQRGYGESDAPRTRSRTWRWTQPERSTHSGSPRPRSSATTGVRRSRG